VLFVDQRALSSETVPEQSNFLLRDVNSPRFLLSIASTTAHDIHFGKVVFCR
jgi:hypothetical protein